MSASKKLSVSRIKTALNHRRTAKDKGKVWILDIALLI